MSQKTIVTHISPDLDAIAATWLLTKYLPDWHETQISFVPAGTTLGNKPVDSDPNIIHVDTGFGRFDHHQKDDDTCATQKVFEYLKKEKLIKPKSIEPLSRIVQFCCDIDHFKEIYFDEPDADQYDFMLNNLIDGLKNNLGADRELVDLGGILLDATLSTFTKKVSAEHELNEGYTFQSPWGKTLAIESDNSEVCRLAQKKGYDMTIQKHSHSGAVRVKLRPDNKKNLKKLYKEVTKLDSKASWFYHIGGRMLLNGSATNPDYSASSLALSTLIDTVRLLRP